MGVVEVESGAAAVAAPPEQAKAVVPETPIKPKNNKNLIIGAVSICILGLAAILIGILPDWDNKNDDGSSSSSSTETKMFESTTGPFNVSIPLFSSDIMNGYESINDVELDFITMAKFKLNNAILNNKNYYYAGRGDDIDMDTTTTGGPAAGVPAFDGSAAAGDNVNEEGKNTVGDDATDYETNNQEEHVDKADIVKSNGQLIFTAYNNYLLVVDVVTGKVINEVQMTPIDYINPNSNDCDDGPIFRGEEEPEEAKEDADTDADGVGDTSTGTSTIGFPAGDDPSVVDTVVTEQEGGAGGDEVGDEIPAPPDAISSSSTTSSAYSLPFHPCYIYQPKPYINALSIKGNHLTVIVTGYGLEHTQGLDIPSTLYDYMNTRILVYDINNGDLILLTSTDVNGSYRNAFTMDNGSTHVVTQAGVNTWDHLLEPIQRWQPVFEGLSDDDYEVEATRLAEEILIPNFIHKLTMDIQMTPGFDIDLTNGSLLRLSLFTNSVSDDTEFETSTTWSNGYANSLTQVISFDMNVPKALGDELMTSTKACFLPSSWGYVYSNEDMLFVAGQGWDWNPEVQASGQTTYLVGFEIQDDTITTIAKVTGSLPGYLLNPYSLDFYNGYLRVATTQSFWSLFMFDDILIREDEDLTTTTTAAVDGARRSTQQETEADDGDIAGDDGANVVLTSHSETEDGHTEDNVNTNEREDGQPDDTASLTENQIVILKVPSGSDTTLERVESVTLGKPNERFTAVRFFDTIAYAVTFERTDPFYVIDLFDNEKPMVLGALEVPGFSSYLHSINEENTKLLAVGQHANDDGRVLGLKISLFDASDPLHPELLDSHIEEQDENVYSSSSVEWDQEAFRYLNLGDYGRLIIPMSIHTWSVLEEPQEFIDEDMATTTTTTASESSSVGSGSISSSSSVSITNEGSFEGFGVFSVVNNKIEREFYINHDDQTVQFNSGCYSCGWLSDRSFVFNGDVVTMKAHTVIRTDLDTGAEVWNTNLDTSTSTSMECCGW